MSSANPFTADTMSSTNPFTSDTSEEELEGPRPGPVSKLFGLSRQEREAREGRGRKGSEEKLLPLVGGGKAKPKTSRGKICFNTPVKADLVVPTTIHNPYNPFSSSSEEDEVGEANCEDRRGRVRGRSVAGQERRRAQLVTTLTLLLVAFVMVTAIISGLATRHSSSVETPLDANVSGGQVLVDLQQGMRHQNQTVELPVMELQGEGENWPDEEELKDPRVTGGKVFEAAMEVDEVTGSGGDQQDGEVELEDQQKLDDQPESSITMDKEWWGGEEGVDQDGNYGEASGEIL